jgi:hypothetical protein
MTVIVTKTHRRVLYTLSDLARAVALTPQAIWWRVHRAKTLPEPVIVLTKGRHYYSEEEYRSLAASITEEREQHNK